MRFVMSAVLLAAMAGGPVAHAVEIPGTKGILELGGFVDALGVVATEGGHYQQPQGLVSLQADADVRRWLSAHAELRGAVGGPFEDADAGLFGFNRTFQNYSPSLDFTEAYIDIQLPYSFELRGGIQRFAWGKLDGFPPTDLLNPRSFHDFLVQDFEEAKVGIPAVQAAYFPEDIPALSLSQLRAALIYVPIAVPARLALPGERWFPPSIEIDSVTVSSTQTGQVASICLDALMDLTEIIGFPPGGNLTIPIDFETQNRTPPRDVHDGGIALRLSGTWRASDWSLYHYTGPYTGPNLALDTDVTLISAEQRLSARVMLRQEHTIVHMTGFDFATTIGGATLRAESAFFQNRPYLRATSNLLGDVGPCELCANIQGLVDHPDQPVPVALGDLFPPLDSIEWGVGIDYLFHGFYPLLQLNQVILLEKGPQLLIDDPETQLTGLVRRSFFGERAELELRSVVSVARGGWFIFPRLSYLLWDRVRLRLGYLAVGGSRNSLIGQFQRNDEFVLQARYNF